MKRETSYQRRLRNIEWYKQYVEDLQGIVVELMKQMKQAGVPPRLKLRGMPGDRYLNPINMGEFPPMGLL